MPKHPHPISPEPDMPPDTSLIMPSLTALASIEAMRGTLAMARALLEGGRVVELAGLEVEAAGICQALGGLPQHAARALRPAMLTLMQEVEALALLMPER
ncbi:hypothetical protein [Rhodovarius sp.]|jgi:hypothetical protein|uniref:hypothetical protein n=1 Tax=Rhodovarius sp. TaxID=2972673 RepID=UPI0033420FD6